MKKINPDDLNVNPIRQYNENKRQKAWEYSNVDDECQTDPALGCTTQLAHGCNDTADTICNTYKCGPSRTCDPSLSQILCCAPDTKGDLCQPKTYALCPSIEECLTSAEVACETDNCKTIEETCIISATPNCVETDLCIHTRNECKETDLCALSVNVECEETDVLCDQTSNNIVCAQGPNDCTATLRLCNLTNTGCETLLTCTDSEACG